MRVIILKKKPNKPTTMEFNKQSPIDICLLCFELDMSSTASQIWTWGSQCVVLSGEVTDLLEMLEEICHWGQTFRVYDITPIPVLSGSCMGLRCDPSARCSFLPPYLPVSMLSQLSWPPEYYVKMNFFLKSFLVMVFDRKRTSTGW